MARARVLEFEHELGSGARASRATPPALAGALTRQLIGYRHTSAPFQSFLETPRVLVTIMIDLEGSANGRPLPTAWIGGLMETYTVVGFSGTYSSIDLKLDPLSNGALLCRSPSWASAVSPWATPSGPRAPSSWIGSVRPRPGTGALTRLSTG